MSLFFPVLCSLLAYRKLQKVSPPPEAMHSTLSKLRVYRHALFPDRSCIVNARLSIYSGYKGPWWLWKSLECTRANKQALTRRVFLLCRSCNARARSRVYQISFLVRVLLIALRNVENLEYKLRGVLLCKLYNGRANTCNFFVVIFLEIRRDFFWKKMKSVSCLEIFYYSVRYIDVKSKFIFPYNL